MVTGSTIRVELVTKSGLSQFPLRPSALSSVCPRRLMPATFRKTAEGAEDFAENAEKNSNRAITVVPQVSSRASLHL